MSTSQTPLARVARCASRLNLDRNPFIPAAHEPLTVVVALPLPFAQKACITGLESAPRWPISCDS